MNFVSRWNCKIVLSALVLAAAGCGGGSAIKRPPTVAATGEVTYKGTPVPEATVALVPAMPSNDPKLQAFPIVAQTDAQGKFTLKTVFSASDTVAGALPGEYKVLVSKATSSAPASHDPNVDPAKAAAQPAAPPPALPAKYSDPAQTTLTATVKSSGPNEFKLALED